jgi:hypothetical protein
MPSVTSFFAIFFAIAFFGGFASGMLLLFIISIHRARHASLFEDNRHRPGAISRSMLISARTDRKDGDK